MAQQTALLRFMHKLIKDYDIYRKNTDIEFIQSVIDYKDLLEEALEMEKEQIKMAFEQGYSIGVDKVFCMDNPELKDAEQYYNLTYGSNNQI